MRADDDRDDLEIWGSTDMIFWQGTSVAKEGEFEISEIQGGCNIRDYLQLSNEGFCLQASRSGDVGVLYCSGNNMVTSPKGWGD